eukprot:CAMPEP_0174296728 /NCGR_PEP_ID=MMETSP0809-20121228/48794_1 /TAXON_ID=73025 ORGANISM="Eutreptiella gymnastica-like, Strain CCMP1594" /NCGR_SAMPLE_ID=MMETSP0809 /ASSEMBLY_ACC=CAM_ASM_000658 /LENGTH=151 /DNA_ID=CAMNT_0015399943 /DNA_START=823 /DNA_END=1275 /DNA_ORIENTATION=+
MPQHFLLPLLNLLRLHHQLLQPLCHVPLFATRQRTAHHPVVVATEQVPGRNAHVLGTHSDRLPNATGRLIRPGRGCDVVGVHREIHSADTFGVADASVDYQSSEPQPSALCSEEFSRARQTRRASDNKHCARGRGGLERLHHCEEVRAVAL